MDNIHLECKHQYIANRICHLWHLQQRKQPPSYRPMGHIDPHKKKPTVDSICGIYIV